VATRRNVAGIILRRTDYAEADRILVVLTKELGKITAIAKGVRKLKSKLAGGIELLSVSELGVLPGRSMYTITSARSTQTFDRIPKDLTTLNIAYDQLKLINKKVEDGEAAELFTVVEQSLYALNEGVDVDLVQVWFYVQVLTYFGQQLNLTHDVNGVELGADLTYALQPSQGALIPSESDYAIFSEDAIKALRLMLRYDPRQLNHVKGVVEAVKKVSPDIEAFTNYQLG